MLVIGFVLVTGTSIGSIFRGLGRAVRGVFVGGRGMAETVVKTREDRARAGGEPETLVGRDRCDEHLPDEDDFEPTVAIGSFDDDVAEAEQGQDEPATDPHMPAAEGEGMGGTDSPPADAGHDLAPPEEAGGLTPMGKPARRYDLR